MGIVFQSYALWPHMSVAGNVAYALKVRGMPAAEREKRVAAALATVGLSDFADRRPASLSGGQRQRVALARCLAMEPSLVLLDEPLSNLDAHLRAAMHAEFAAFHERARTTMVYITHDQAEAMALADRIAVMDGGRLLQAAPPSALYREPANATVARFVGEGLVLPARALDRRGAGHCDVELFGAISPMRCSPGEKGGRQAEICLRPGNLALAAEGLPARIVSRPTAAVPSEAWRRPTPRPTSACCSTCLSRLRSPLATPSISLSATAGSFHRMSDGVADGRGGS